MTSPSFWQFFRLIQWSSVGPHPVAVEVLEDPVVFQEPRPVPRVQHLLVEYDAVVLGLRQELVQVSDLGQLGILQDPQVGAQELPEVLVGEGAVDQLHDAHVYIYMEILFFSQEPSEAHA